MGNFFKDIFNLSPIGAITNAIGGGDGKGDGSGVTAVADPYGGLRNSLLNWLTPQVGKPGAKYTGEMVAPMSTQEGKSLDFLDNYGNSQPGETFNNAKAEINKTLTGGYDPSTSPYYQAVKAEANRNADITNKRIASDAAGGGRYYTGARIQQQREASTDSTNKINEVLGQAAENERNRMMGVLPQAEEMGKYEQDMPLKQAAAFQSLGALPRTIAQAKDQAAMEDWLRSEVNYPLQIGSMAANIQQPPLYQQNQPDFLHQLMSGAGSALGSAGTMALMSMFL